MKRFESVNRLCRFAVVPLVHALVPWVLRSSPCNRLSLWGIPRKMPGDFTPTERGRYPGSAVCRPGRNSGATGRVCPFCIFSGAGEFAVGRPAGNSAGRKDLLRIIQTGDDLRIFVALAQSGQFRQGFGGVARRLVAQWLNHELSEYQAITYADSGERLSLRNILRLTHPHPASPVNQAIFQWLVRGT